MSRSVSGSRGSRFVETPMHEYTPENSLYDEDMDEMVERVDATPTRIVLRAANAVTHLAVCAVLLAIMAVFLSFGRGRGVWYQYMTPEAVTLVALLALDACLDMWALARVRNRRPGWSLLLRLVFGVGYLAVFMVYVGLGRVFPYGYSYWGLSPGFAGPVVYLFLWVIGVWNLLNTALHRHTFGHDMRRYSAAVGESLAGFSLRRLLQRRRRRDGVIEGAGDSDEREGAGRAGSRGRPRDDGPDRDVERAAPRAHGSADNVIVLHERIPGSPKAEDSVSPTTTRSSSSAAKSDDEAGPGVPSGRVVIARPPPAATAGTRL